MSFASSVGQIKRSPLLVGTAGSEKAAVNLQVLKEYYIPAVRDLMNSRTVALKLLKRAEKYEISGQFAKIPLRIGRNQGIGHVGERGALPDAGAQVYDSANYWLMYYYGRMKFSGPSVDATDSTEGSYLEIMDSEATGLAQDMARDMNRVAYGDGSGRLAQLTAAAGTTTNTATASNPGGFANQGPGTQYLTEGMRVGIVTHVAGGGTLTAVREIALVNRTTQVVTFDSGVPWPATGNYYLVRASNTTTTNLNDTGWMREPWGFAAIFSEDNPFRNLNATNEYLGQVNRTNVPAWRAIQRDNSGTAVPFFASYFQSILDDLATAGGDGNVETFLASYGIRLAYLDTFSGGRTYPETMDFDGGFKTLSYAGRPIVPDRDMTKGWVYGCDWSNLKMLFGNDYDFMSRDGSYLQRAQDEDAYGATMFRYHNIVTDAPNRLGVIKDILDV